MTETAARVKKIIAQQLNTQEGKIKLEDKFIEDLGADSLDIVELIMALEDEFGTKIPDDEAELLTTVGEAIAYVEKRVNSAADKDVDVNSSADSSTHKDEVKFDKPVSGSEKDSAQ